MKHRLEIFLHIQGHARITAIINNVCYYQGSVVDLELPFEISDTNQLRLVFSEVQGQVEIRGISYNHLSIEHFIYQGQFHELGHQSPQPRTHIDRDGTWVYEFDSELAKQIIKANT